MLTNLSDIYNAKVGDKLVLDKSTTVVHEVYAEAISNGKWISLLEHLIDPTWIVEILNTDDIKNSDITNHIIMSEFHGIEEDGKLVLEIPSHINVNSLSSRVYATIPFATLRMTAASSATWSSFPLLSRSSICSSRTWMTMQASA